MDENNEYMSVADRVRELTESAFSKALASVIIAEIPIGSIIAIVLGNKAERLREEAESLAVQNRLEVGGKNIAARVLGTIGRILGTVMTLVWIFVGFIYTIMIASLIG